VEVHNGNSIRYHHPPLGKKVHAEMEDGDAGPHNKHSSCSVIFIILTMALVYSTFTQMFTSDIGVALIFFLFVFGIFLSTVGLTANHFAQMRCDGPENQKRE